MSIQVPVKCKLCQQAIRLPDFRTPIIGEPEIVRQRRAFLKLLEHFGQTHEEQFVALAAVANNLLGILVAGMFDLPEQMRNSHELERSKIHQMTQRKKLTDQELEQRAREVWNVEEALTEQHLLAVMREMRDMYEELGAYAPAPPELVKNQNLGPVEFARVHNVKT